eukprot:SAG31_NODE_42364_length_272_cov_0.595376_1_plen_32_part_01
MCFMIMCHDVAAISGASGSERAEARAKIYYLK